MSRSSACICATSASTESKRFIAADAVDELELDRAAVQVELLVEEVRLDLVLRARPSKVGLLPIETAAP